jgi:hypothetical protein
MAASTAATARERIARFYDVMAADCRWRTGTDMQRPADSWR